MATARCSSFVENPVRFSLRLTTWTEDAMFSVSPGSTVLCPTVSTPRGEIVSASSALWNKMYLLLHTIWGLILSVVESKAIFFSEISSHTHTYTHIYNRLTKSVSEAQSTLSWVCLSSPGITICTPLSWNWKETCHLNTKLKYVYFCQMGSQFNSAGFVGQRDAKQAMCKCFNFCIMLLLTQLLWDGCLSILSMLARESN